MPDGDQNLPAVPPQEVGMEKFAPSLTVVGPDKKKFEVPVNAAANRAFAQMTVARVRGLLWKKLDEIEKSGAIPDVISINRLASAASAVEDMAAASFGMRKPSSEAKLDEFGRLGISLVEAAAAGAAAGASARSEDGMAFRDRLRKIKNLGKEMKTAEPVDVVADEIAP